MWPLPGRAEWQGRPAERSVCPADGFWEVRGLSLVELLLALALASVVLAASVPRLLTGRTSQEVRAATRYVVTRIMLARSRAVRFGASVGLRFEPEQDDTTGGFQLSAFLDGDGDGVRSDDIVTGVDRLLEASERVSDLFPAVRLGLLPGVPEIGEARAPGSRSALEEHGLRLGESNILTMTPVGTSTSGTVYLKGDDGPQYAIRVFGGTGRVTVFRFDPTTGGWEER